MSEGRGHDPVPPGTPEQEPVFPPVPPKPAGSPPVPVAGQDTGGAETPDAAGTPVVEGAADADESPRTEVVPVVGAGGPRPASESPWLTVGPAPAPPKARAVDEGGTRFTEPRWTPPGRPAAPAGAEAAKPAEERRPPRPATPPPAAEAAAPKDAERPAGAGSAVPPGAPEDAEPAAGAGSAVPPAPPYPPAPPRPDGPPPGPHVRTDLGAFVLGTLDDAAARAVRAHVAVCAACRTEYDELAALPAYLAHLTPGEAEASGAAEGGVPDRMLATAAVHASSHRHRGRLLLAAAAAAVVVAAGAGWAVGNATGDSGPSASATAPTPSGQPPTNSQGPSAGPPGQGVRTLSRTDPVSGASATVRYWEQAWGSSIDVSLTGVPAGTRCELDVYAADGHWDTAASWVVPGAAGYQGGPRVGGLTGATSIAPADVVSMRITVVGSKADKPLVTLTAATGQATPGTS